MRRSTVPVQQWVDSLPSPSKSATAIPLEVEGNPTPPLTPVSSEESIFSKPIMTVSTPIAVPGSPAGTATGISSPLAHNRLARDPSFQSDSSHCSSVESLLELRRADPEAILLGLGFGGCPNNQQENGPLSRIPKRFLQPSKLQGITINDFVKHEQETSESLDSASLGYRGLTGSPYVAPSEIVQKIMERLRDHESHEQDAYTVHNTNTEPYSPIFQDTGRLSVLSPDNRQFLERPRSKSPDMRNKRMIIGQKSFAFGCDGDLIELDRSSQQDSENSSTNGNADNHESEPEDKFALEDAALNNDLETMCPDNGDAKSTMSNFRLKKRLSKQFSIDDSAQDLISPNNNSLPDQLYSRSYEDSLEPTSSQLTQEFVERNREPRRIRDEKSDDDRALNHRRSSYDSPGIKKTPWSRLSKEEKRRYSDGSLRQSTGSLNRRRSFKRQTRISDVEAEQYCSNLVPAEGNEASELAGNSEGASGISKSRKLEGIETDEKIDRSEILNSSDMTTEDSDFPGEVNGPANTNAINAKNSRTKKREKKRRGLSTVLGIYSSVTNVKMEPGF